jgi:RimJ/RimL family protein N-acetyltransferase
MKKIRVYLRAFEPDDYILLHEWRKNDEIFGFYRGVIKYSSSLNEKIWVEERIKDKDNVSCAICLKNTDEFIGCSFLNSIDLINRSARGGTFIGSKQHIGKGFGMEGRLIMLHHAFYDWGLERVWALVHEYNLNSIKMHEKCGYIKEGVLRNSSYKAGKFHNVIIMSVLRNEFEEVLKEYEL